MPKTWQRELAVPLLLSLYLVYYAIQLWNANKSGKVYPSLLLALCAIFIVSIVGRALLRSFKTDVTQDGDAETQTWSFGRVFSPAVLVVMTTGVYTATLNIVGFLAGTTGLLTVLLCLFGRRRIVWFAAYAGISLLLSFALATLLDDVMGIPVPRSIFSSF